MQSALLLEMLPHALSVASSPSQPLLSFSADGRTDQSDEWANEPNGRADESEWWPAGKTK